MVSIKGKKKERRELQKEREFWPWEGVDPKNHHNPTKRMNGSKLPDDIQWK